MNAKIKRVGGVSSAVQKLLVFWMNLNETLTLQIIRYKNTIIQLIQYSEVFKKI